MIDCNGGTVSFTNTSTAAFGYVWDFGDGTAPSFQENPVHTYANSGTYTVTLDIVYEVSCAEAFSMQVEVQEPQIFAGFTYDITECSADAAVIQFFDASSNTLNNTNSWNWTFENATPATSMLQNPVVTVNSEGPLTVTLTIGTANDCSNSITETLEIDLVDLDISFTDTLVVCLGDDVQLNPVGDPDLTYSWSPSIGLDDPTATSPVATPLMTTTYIATAYSTVGADTCFVTDSVVVFVPEDIMLELDQEPVVVTCGETVIINATANVDIDVQWCSTIDGVIGTGSSISINPFRTDTIIAKATDEFGCMAMDTIIVVDNGVDIELGDGGEITACQGVETTLFVTNLDDQDVLTYSWSPEANIVGPTDGSSVAIVVNEPGMVIFTAIVANQFDCQDTVMFTVTVQDFQGEVADTVLVCYDEPTPINPGGNPDYQYNWSPTTGLDLSNPANPIATLTENQTYFVTITDPVTTCTDTDSIVVIVQPDLDLQTTGGTQLCEAAPVTLTATTAVAADIVWYLDGEIIGMGNTITVTPPNVDGCFTYTAIATDPLTNCEQTSSQEICLQIFTDELPLEDVIVCANEPTPINPGGDPTLIYTWTPEDEFIDLTNPWNPVVTTGMPLTYFVTVVDTAFGCSVTDTINIDIAPELNLSISPESIVLCEAGDVTLTANTDFPAESVNWFLLPNNDPLGTGTEVTFMPPAGTSQVYAVATSSNGCTERDTITINNFPLDVAITDAIVICEPTATVDLSIFNNDLTQVLTVAWEPEGVLTALDQLTVTVDPNITTSFSATVTNQFGCTTVLNTSVTVINLEADLTISAPDTILLGESSTITVEGCIGCTYEWDPADIDSPIIVVTPTETGNNIYTVFVNQLGCEYDLETSVFVINGECTTDRVFLPNAFTPNNDGDNDVLHLRSSFLDQLTEVEFLIYNRWGEEMFRTQDPYQGWDGTYRGEQLAPDVYGFYLRVLCPNGDELVQKGNITILR
jgi:gliding motility-associated-like protein